MDLLVWIVFGAFVGWIASIIMKTNEQQGGIANIVIGIVGALIGGLVSRSLGGDGVTGFNLMSFIVAVLGAMALIAIVRAFSHAADTQR